MKKAFSVMLVGAVALTMCSSVLAAEANISTTPNDGGLSVIQDNSTQQGPLGLSGAVGGVCRADITDGSKIEIPIDKPDGTGAIGLDVEIIKGGAYIESVSVQNNRLVVSVKNPGNLTQPVEYTVFVTLYDMASGQPSKFYITGTIGAQPTSSSEPDNSSSSPSSEPDNSSSQPDNSSSSQPDTGSSSSQPDTITQIGLKGMENGVVRADLFKYGGNDEAEIVIEVPEGAGTIRLDRKDVIDGDDFIRKVSVKGTKLIVEGKFPSDLLEPEDYKLDVTLSGTTSGEKKTFRVEGTVYWQDSYGPVAPDEYREKKYVVVDFDGNDNETINFKHGCLMTDGLKSGVANLDVGYSSSSNTDADGLDLYTVNFTAAPRLDRNVTVCLDADEGNAVYEVKNGKLTKIDARFNKSAGELRFDARRLGEYIVTEKTLSSSENTSGSKDTTGTGSSASSSTENNSNQTNTGSQTSKPADTVINTKPVPNTGRFK